MIGAKIRCDNCNFTGDMPLAANCRTTATAPDGWATVYPTVRLKGERSLEPEKRKLFKQKISEKTPPFHICPKCVFGVWEVRLDRLLEAPGK